MAVQVLLFSSCSVEYPNDYGSSGGPSSEYHRLLRPHNYMYPPGGYPPLGRARRGVLRPSTSTRPSRLLGGIIKFFGLTHEASRT